MPKNPDNRLTPQTEEPASSPLTEIADVLNAIEHQMPALADSESAQLLLTSLLEESQKDPVNLLYKLLQFYITFHLDQGISQETEERSLSTHYVDPRYVDYAFQCLSREKSGPKPMRFLKLRSAFLNRENEDVPLSDLETIFADHANPRAYTQTAIFDLNQAFIKNNLALEIRGISENSRQGYETIYRLRMTTSS